MSEPYKVIVTRDQLKLLINALDMKLVRLKTSEEEILLRLNFEISYRYGRNEDFFMITIDKLLVLTSYLKQWIKSYLVGYIETEENKGMLKELRVLDRLLIHELNEIPLDMRKQIAYGDKIKALSR